MKQTIAVCVAVLALLIVPCNAQNRLGGGTDGQGGPQAGSLYRIYDTSQVKPIYRQRYKFIRRIPPGYYSTQGRQVYR